MRPIFLLLGCLVMQYPKAQTPDSEIDVMLAWKRQVQHGLKNASDDTSRHAFVEEYIRFLYHSLRDKDNSLNVTIERNWDPTAGSLSLASPDLGRVILNIITNAYTVLEKKSISASDYAYRGPLKKSE